MSFRQDADILSRVLGHHEIAVEVYDEMLRTSAAKDPTTWDLNRICDDHRQAIARLKQQIVNLGCEPTGGGRGSWHMPERDKGLRLIDDFRVLEALRDGEVRELLACRRALKRESDYEPARALLRDQIIPMLQGHVDTLDGF